MRLSACIVNWNTREYLRTCLASLRASELAGGLEVIVVDNASSDGSADLVRAEFPEVLLIANANNRYYAAGNNQAIGKASGEFVALLNPDVALPTDGLERLCGFLEEHEDAAAVAPRLILPDGSVQRSVRGFPGPREVLCEALLLSRLFPRSKALARYWLPGFRYDEVRRVAQPMASCLIFRRSVLMELGGFDERFPMFFNDVDLCRRTQELGWSVYFIPDVNVAHHHGASTKQVWRNMVRESNRGLLAYLHKHHRREALYVPAVLVARAAGLAKWLLAPRPRR